MPMTEQEAFQLISLVSDSYNMEFHKSKYDAWTSILTKEGDYKASVKKLKKFIKESKYKPTLADVLAIKPKEFVAEEKPKEETHQYKLKHDPEYAEQWRKVKERGFQLLQELKADD